MQLTESSVSPLILVLPDICIKGHWIIRYFHHQYFCYSAKTVDVKMCDVMLNTMMLCKMYRVMHNSTL